MGVLRCSLSVQSTAELIFIYRVNTEIYTDGNHMAEKTLPALKENFESFMQFIEEEAKKIGFSKSQLFKINLAAEEAVINVINYAYVEKEAEMLTVICTVLPALSPGLKVDIIDSGIPFNPLKRETPDTTLEVHEREIGGLGIHMIRKCTTCVNYTDENEQNRLTMTFHLSDDLKEK